ncbi:Wzz/FepE/Etk N-terminal domain-containing protein [Providencia sp. PROV111]|uniref:Wzz/FepE/Etk N-terminal domain-containing protein n=1 Tax=Providencia sp. PROV111 TaxID=2949822 RepID=UPI00234A97C9|nr:Wzz/FepE/Etk N-terminal domain-containing protein [Providencia sp. PROV111]
MKESNHSDEIDFLSLIKTLWSSKFIILIFSFFSLLIGSVIYISMPVKYISKAIVSQPEIGQIAEYYNAMNLVMNDVSGYDYDPVKKAFNLFLLYSDSYVNEHGENSPLKIVKDKDYYIFSLVSSKPELSQSILNDLLISFDDKTKFDLYKSIGRLIFNKINSTKKEMDSLRINAIKKNEILESDNSDLNIMASDSLTETKLYPGRNVIPAALWKKETIQFYSAGNSNAKVFPESEYVQMNRGSCKKYWSK